MPKLADELSALTVSRLRHLGGRGDSVIAVGGVSGLCLRITPGGGRSWLLRARYGGRRREIGLGPYPEIGLAKARDAAREVKEQIRAGRDPIEERRQMRAAALAEARRSITFADAVKRTLAAKLPGFGSEKYRKTWRQSLEAYALPELGPMMVQDIAPKHVVRVLQPIWLEKRVTASRLRQRIEAVFAWAAAAGYFEGDNPARWRGNLKELLSAQKIASHVVNRPALQIADAPRWFAALRKREGTGSRAVEFAALTAARSGEVRGATWAEIDLDRALWTIPASRMKAEREHRVVLSPEAVALLKALPRHKDNPLVFVAPRGGELSDMTLSATMRRLHEADIAAGGPGFVDRASGRPAVPHGLRSTFRDWVAEETKYPGDMAELALAHRVADAVEAAYRRGDMVKKRRAMMADWAGFLHGREAEGGNVVRLPGAEA